MSIVVTGASSGIVPCSPSGWDLRGIASPPPRAARRSLRRSHAASAGALVVPTDVTRRADVERLRDRAIEAFGYVDVWVNNAGRGMTKAALELTDRLHPVERRFHIGGNHQRRAPRR